jgi:hypothetical protein
MLPLPEPQPASSRAGNAAYRRMVLSSIGAILMYACSGSNAGSLSTASRGDSLSLDSLRCVEEGPAHACALYGVSVYELVAKPVEYHGKRVRVLGFAHFEFEGNGLYAHREDFEQSLYRNGLWLNWAPGPSDSSQNRYVLVEGTFDARMRGHFGMWSGSLSEVTRVDVMGKLVIPPLESIPTVDLGGRR